MSIKLLFIYFITCCTLKQRMFCSRFYHDLRVKSATSIVFRVFDAFMNLFHDIDVGIFSRHRNVFFRVIDVSTFLRIINHYHFKYKFSFRVNVSSAVWFFVCLLFVSIKGRREARKARRETRDERQEARYEVGGRER